MSQPSSPTVVISVMSSSLVDASLNLILSCILVLWPCQNSSMCGTTLHHNVMTMLSECVLCHLYPPQSGLGTGSSPDPYLASNSVSLSVNTSRFLITYDTMGNQSVFMNLFVNLLMVIQADPIWKVLSTHGTIIFHTINMTFYMFSNSGLVFVAI